MEKKEQKPGFLKLKWAEDHMPLMGVIRNRFKTERPFADFKIGMALHVEAKTGILALLLREGGADVYLTSCNPLTSDDEVITSLREDFSLNVYGKRGESREDYYKNLDHVLGFSPDIIIDDGGDLTRLLHTEKSNLSENIIGGNEETTTGVNRLRVMDKKGILRFPMFNVNDAIMKHFFDNRYGTGQSTLEGIMVATNLLLSGKEATVCGYGYCGKGIASRLRGLGAHVSVTEIDPMKAVEAVMDGFPVRPIRESLNKSDFAVTATGMKSVIRYDDLLTAKPGIVLANAGHFNNEIEVDRLDKLSIKKEPMRKNVTRYFLGNGNHVDVLSEGRLVNLASGQGHPVEIMDMSFAIQALVAEYIVKNHSSLENKLYPVPVEIDNSVAMLKLQSLGISLDKLDEEQLDYANSWEEGT